MRNKNIAYFIDLEFGGEKELRISSSIITSLRKIVGPRMATKLTMTKKLANVIFNQKINNVK